MDVFARGGGRSVDEDADGNIGGGRGATEQSAVDDYAESGVLAATFCRNSRVLRWHDLFAPPSFDLRDGKFSYLVSPVRHGRRRSDYYSAASHALTPTPDIGGSVATTSVNLVLSLLRLPRQRTVHVVSNDSAPFRALADVAMSIRHPYLSRIIGMHAVSPTRL